MVSTKDMRRPDLVVPYVEPEKDEKPQDMSSTISTTMPMMAMFTRNKMLGWVAFVFAMQSWLAETPESRKNATTPSYMGLLLSILGLGSSYMQLFLPPSMQAKLPGTGTPAKA